MSQHNHPVGFQPSGEGPEHGRVLVVVLHGWRGSPDQMEDVKQAVLEAYNNEPGLDVYVPPLPYIPPLPNLLGPKGKRAAAIVSELLEEMDTICGQDPERYSRIVLIGSSLGAVFTRRLFLAATDIAETVRDPSIKNARLRPWVHQVERIVTLGGLNRGWLVSGRLGWTESFVYNFIGLVGHLWLGADKPTIFEARRGAPFIVQTRLQWLAWRRSPESEKLKPLVIQLLGTQDNHVAPDDAVDFAVDRGRESPYFYFALPNTQHENAIVFSRNGEFGAVRKKRFGCRSDTDQYLWPNSWGYRA